MSSIKVGDIVEYHGSVVEAHGVYRASAVQAGLLILTPYKASPACWPGIPEGTPMRSLHDVRQTSVTLWEG